MKNKPISTIIAFGISICFAVCFVVLVIISGLKPLFTAENVESSSTVDEVVTVEQISAPTESETTAPTTTETEPTNVVTYDNENHYNNYESYSDYEYDLVARTIYQEAGGCSEYCQWLVGSTVLNLADARGGIENVVFDYNTFNVAYVLYDCTPSELSYSVAARVLSGDRDYNVKAFRTDYYHSFGTPYMCVDNVYFSVY